MEVSNVRDDAYLPCETSRNGRETAANPRIGRETAVNRARIGRETLRNGRENRRETLVNYSRIRVIPSSHGAWLLLNT